MASQQDTRRKEVKAEQAARTAADELHDVNKQRGTAGTGGGAGGADVVVEHHETRTDDRNRPGIIGSVFQTVTGALGGAKDAVIGKTHEGTEKANIVSRDAAERERRNEEEAARKAEEYKEAAARKAEETKDAAMEKGREYKDSTSQKAKEAAEKTGEYKDYTAQKAKEAAEKTGEYKDYTAEKEKEAKDKTMGKMGEIKDTTVEKTKETADATAQKAREMKDTTMGKLGEYKDSAVEKTKETADATAQKAKEAKDYTAEKTKETADATAQKAKEAKDYTSEKAKEGKDSAVGKLTELKDKAMGLFSGRKDENTAGRTGDYFTKSAFDEAEDDARRKLETTHLKDQGYEARGTKMDTGGRSGGRGEEVVAATVAVERVGGAAEAFRKADQMTGQAFNDVGPMDEDVAGSGAREAGGGVYRVQLKRVNK